MYEAIIVGSGPAGTFAAYKLRGENVLLLDVGFAPPDSSALGDNIFRLRLKSEDLFLPLIGKNFESLHNVYGTQISLKLKAPYMSFIVKDREKLSPVDSPDFDGSLQFCEEADWQTPGGQGFTVSTMTISAVFRLALQSWNPITRS